MLKLAKMSFSFGTPSSAPATTGLAGGFSFGTNKPATPGFGMTATSQPSTGLFGSTSATPAPAFGTAGFGSTTPAFGSTTTPAFGASTTPAFGTTTNPGFGSTPAFGANSAAPVFGTTTPAFGSTAPTFGTGTSAFGTTTTPAFGTGTAGSNFSLGSNTLGGFGTQPATTSTTGLGLSFGLGTATTQTGFGLLGAAGTATTSSSLFGPKLGTTSLTGTQPSTLGTSSFGLGGVAPATSGIGVTNTTDAKTEPPKQTKLPNEISTTVDSFKEFVKKQKSLSSEVMRVSIKPLHKVAGEAAVLTREAARVCGEVARARCVSRRQRAAAAAALAAADTVLRDNAAPGSELEGMAPPQYVKDLISELEQHLITFRRQMEIADKQMQSTPKLLTEKELTLGIRRMHESLVALAGRLQTVHSQVEEQLRQYKNLRTYILKEPAATFDLLQNHNTSLDQMLQEDVSGKRKFKSTLTGEVNRVSAVLADPRAALGGVHQLAGPTPFSYIGSNLTPITNVDNSATSWPPHSNPPPQTNSTSALLLTGPSSFQLQKPPGKRGKQ